MQTELQNKKLAHISIPKPAKERSKPVQITSWDIVILMQHDAYRRVRGRIQQRRWAQYE